LGIEDYDFPARGGIKKVNAFALTREEAKQDDERLGAAVTRI
jgi:hypothetical protein